MEGQRQPKPAEWRLLLDCRNYRPSICKNSWVAPRKVKNNVPYLERCKQGSIIADYQSTQPHTRLPLGHGRARRLAIKGGLLRPRDGRVAMIITRQCKRTCRTALKLRRRRRDTSGEITSDLSLILLARGPDKRTRATPTFLRLFVSPVVEQKEHYRRRRRRRRRHRNVEPDDLDSTCLLPSGGAGIKK